VPALDPGGLLACRLQGDDAARKLGRQRARLVARGRRAVGGRVDPAGGLAPRPVAGLLVDAPGDAAAAGQQRPDGNVDPGRRIEAADRPHGVRVERLEPQRIVRGKPVEILARGQDEHRQPTESPGELAERGEHVGRGAVDVVEDEQRGPLLVADLRDGGERGLWRTGPGRVADRGALTVDLGCERSGDAGLARAAAARERDERAHPACRPLPAHAQAAQLAVAADQRRRVGGVELGGEVDGRALDVERGILSQDRIVQAPELGPRLHADLVDQGPAGVLVGLQRLGLAAAAVEREHPLRVQPLTQRVASQQRFDLGDDLQMAARSEVRLDGEARRGLAQALETRDLARRERLVRQVRERLPAEQRQRFARRVPGIPGGAVTARLGDQPLEAADVDQLRIDAQLVAASMRQDRRAAVLRQRVAEPPDVVLDHLAGARGWLIAPQALGQAIRGDRTVRLEPEHREDGALLGAAEHDRPVVDRDLQVPEDADLHEAALVVFAERDQPNHLLASRSNSAPT
jgi:hypothetical protein